MCVFTEYSPRVFAGFGFFCAARVHLVKPRCLLEFQVFPWGKPGGQDEVRKPGFHLVFPRAKYVGRELAHFQAIPPPFPYHFPAAPETAKICEHPLTSLKVIFPTEQSVLRHLRFPSIFPKWSNSACFPGFPQGKPRRLPGFAMGFACVPGFHQAILPGFYQGKTW